MTNALALPFYIPRREMPQIDDVPACLDWCARQGVEHSLLRQQPALFYRNHQHVVIDPRRVAAITQSMLRAPILVASDGFILDGNHRWALARDHGFLLDVQRLNAEFGTAITMLARWPLVRFEPGEV